MICFWSWCSSLNSSETHEPWAWVSVCMWEFSGYKWNFATISFHDFHTERFFPPSLSSYWIHFSAALALDFLAMAAQHSDILHQLFTVTDDVNQFPEWFAVRKVFFVQKCTPFYLRWSRFLSVTKVFHTNNNSNKECFWSRKLLNLCMSQEKTCRV